MSADLGSAAAAMLPSEVKGEATTSLGGCRILYRSHCTAFRVIERKQLERKLTVSTRYTNAVVELFAQIYFKYCRVITVTSQDFSYCTPTRTAA
jgi:hypothetical protein